MGKENVSTDTFCCSWEVNKGVVQVTAEEVIRIVLMGEESKSVVDIMPSMIDVLGSILSTEM